MKPADFRAPNQTDCAIVTFHDYFSSQYIGCLVTLLPSGQRERRNYDGDGGVLLVTGQISFLHSCSEILSLCSLQ